MNVYFLSFAGGERNGAVIVRADDLDSAIRRATELELNPGGEVLGAAWPDMPEVWADVEARFGGFEKFIPRSDLEAMAGMRRIRTVVGAGGMVN